MDAQHRTGDDMILGIDVGKDQGKIDWDKANQNGVRFAFIRNTFGLYEGDYDVQWYRNWSEAKRVGIPRGAYQYILSYQSITKQARLFVERMDGDFGEIPPVLDFESWRRNDGKYESYPTLAQAKQWCETVEMLTGRTPIIYCGGYWKGFADAKDAIWALRYGHWLAQYKTSPGNETPCPPWNKWNFWQYTSAGDGSLIGVSANIDMNYFNGDEEEFAKYLKDFEGETPVNPPEEEHVKVVNCEWLSFRSKPEAYAGDRPAIGEGVICTVLERLDGWLFVQLSGGDTGYISEKYTKSL
jgi:lysozyme